MVPLHTAVFALAVVVSAMPMVDAQSGLILGTEELPEVIDNGKDVEYDDTYPGAQDHDYLDLLAAWFQHDADSDTIGFTLKVADARLLAGDTTGWTITCNIGGDMFSDAEPTGRISYSWIKDSNANDVRSAVNWRPADAGPNSVGDTTADLKHTFVASLEDPGYFEFRTSRAELVLHGDTIAEFTGTCYEVFDPTNTVGFLFPNGDGAASQASYSLVELRQTKRHDGSFDPIEKLRTESAPPSVPATDSGSTPGFTVALAVLGLFAFIALRRRN